MNRIEKKFLELRKKRKRAFITYITAGYPSLKMTEDIVLALESAGVDIVELGVPFSDPMADGLTIQKSSEKALERGANLTGILKRVKSIRSKSDIPIVLMSYLNPVYHYGMDKFVKDAVSCGVDGVIFPDLPPDEAEDIVRYSNNMKFSVIFLASPTSTVERLKIIAKRSQGFIYYVSLTGVTGARKVLPADIAAHIKKIKEFTAKPVCVGFGVSNAVQQREINSIADGVIVGSAVVDFIRKNETRKDLGQRVGGFIKRRFDLT
ncbi:MAG: tryptophan synthase subunit alpha [Candidatus Omnitrophica bacterium]|nr:tryptophan synthase subunit alpha [Candidatus Omnitrophota bacterium]